MAGVAGFEPAPTVLESISTKRSENGRFLFEVIDMCSMETIQHGAIRHMMKESMQKPNGISAGRAYEIAMSYLKNENAVIELLTSSKCQYTRAEINRAFYDRKYSQERKKQLKLQKA